MPVCPHCSRQIGDAPELAGQVVECPFCRGQMLMPGQLANVQAVPNIVITHQHALAPRSGSRSKRRGMSLETRVILIAAALTVLIGGGVFAVYVARVEYTKHAVKSAFKDIGSEIRKRDEEGRPYVRQALQAHGLTLADNANIDASGDSYDFSGSAKDSRGVHQVRGRVKVAKFGQESTVEVTRLYVDDELVAGEEEYQYKPFTLPR